MGEDHSHDHSGDDHTHEHDEERRHGQDDEEQRHDHSHDHHAHDTEDVGFAVLTVSSSRTLEDDPAGDTIELTVGEAGHGVVARELVGDSHDDIRETVAGFIERDDVDCVVTTGGTGVTPDDVTIEAIESFFEKELPGFGELFRTRSYEEIGTKVVGTRATAGVADGTVVFCLPGSENAARLGIEEIIVEEAPHLSGLVTRDS
ncbi:MAG: molybdopterin-binding protein [Natronomonas sp.]